MRREADNRRAKKNNGGFTTVEQIVVVVLVLVLASALIFGITKWVENIQFKRQNEYARTLFVAAQNQLTEYSTSGQLVDFQEAVESADDVDVTTLIGSDGAHYDLDKVWPESADKGDNKSRYRGEVKSIIGTADDYKAYLERKKNSGNTDEEYAQMDAFYDLFSSYLYDTSILNATVCIEFTPEDGQVFAVLYSDRKDNFTYSETSSSNDVASIYDRTAKARKPQMVGYYGVDMLSKATSTKAEKPSITQVKLNNEDTLNLTFMIGKPKEATLELKYEITVNDNTTKKPLFRFVLDGTKIKNENNAYAIPCEVSRYVYDDKGEHTIYSMGEYNVQSWIDTEQKVHLILDAADLGATSAVYKENYELLTKDGQLTEGEKSALSAIKKTMSFRRFGVDANDIYCTIKGSGQYYKDTAQKQSNSENAYFGSYQKIETQDHKINVTYTIKNTRHLYNMRYIEDYTAKERDDMGYEDTTDKITYQVANAMDWEGFQNNNALYKNGAAASTKTQDFPSFKQLRETSVLESTGNNSNTIATLSITVDSNNEAKLYESTEEKDRAAGLFLDNYGTIQNVTLDQISVKGENSVAAFCGKDHGTLKNLTVQNTNAKSEIQGNQNVGGIVGLREVSQTEGAKVYEGLTNYAKVTDVDASSISYYGGIVGRIQTSAGASITLRDCDNYGQVEATKANNPNSIGGIVGSTSAGNGSITLEQCTSSPQYTTDEISVILASEQALQAKLKGQYVGGIIGYNDGASIKDCNTEKESSSKEGYVFGNEYVGGIVGYNTPNADTNESVITGGEGNRRGVNAAHVIGNQYVGGIIGSNIKSGRIENWINRGFVAAVDSYAGGIAGYNGDSTNANADGAPFTGTAVISNCSSDVANNSAANTLSESELFVADYVGGITGYNDGTLTSGSNDTISLVANLTGDNYLGGVVGYNDVGADVNNYAVAGGYVHGTGVYVGGFAGFNASKLLLAQDNGTGKFIQSNPNQITGTYCVGGTIGGNIVPTDSNITTIFEGDNFLGELNASEAIAGGFIGYNKLVNVSATKDQIKDEAAHNISALEEMGSIAQLANPQGVIGQVDNSLLTSGAQLIIAGDGGTSTQARFGGVTAKIHVGGVLGYNDAGTNLLVQNVLNKTPVTATESVSYEEEQPGRTTYTEDPFLYSYAGGIIGKVCARTTIDNCRNQDAGDVTTQGTYLGGLCEINEGTITNCGVSSIGSASSDYVGGIAGVNKGSGTITNCTFSGRTVTGRNFVGGMVAENYSTITGVAVNMGTVRAYGSEGYVGGVAGNNAGNIVVQPNDGVAVNNITIEGNGNYTGGIAGVNAGSITQDGNGTTVTGRITGTWAVGGITGENRSGNLVAFSNQASVTAINGEAGGIAGRTNGNISDCINQGTITAQQTGNAGGMTANNTNGIANCVDNGSISAPNGIAGGITGNNSGTIEGCSVRPAANVGYLVFESRDRVGGVSGVNSGAITSSSVSAISLYNLASSQGSMLGGITAENQGTITTCDVGTNTEGITLQSRSAVVDMGGVAGTNVGTITGAGSGNYTNVYADLSLANTAIYGNMGGIAGKNEGTISGYAFNGTVAGTANNPQNAPQYNPNTDYETGGAIVYGYGGIAGVNGSSSSATAGRIENCRVNRGKITTVGDSNNIANSGGVAGVNGVGGTIANITFGTGNAYNYSNAIENTSTSASVQAVSGDVYVGVAAAGAGYAHAGGIAGLNSGAILDITENNATGVLIENYSGHIGGVVGYNRRTGSLNRVETGSRWFVYAASNAQDNGCGGIIGYNASEQDLTYCINRAYVRKMVNNSNAIGGMIGRQECATSSGWSISHCINYGFIEGKNRIGGMIGVWKYYGGFITDCINYGTIQSEAQGAGGMVGMLYQLNYSPAQIMRCENHGTIKGTYSGGIIGNANNGGLGYNRLQIDHCVNTGLFGGSGGTVGGIVGGGGTYTSDSYVRSSTNYGYHLNTNLSSASSMGGIASANSSNIPISKCFAIADTVSPIWSRAVREKNYYIAYGQTASGTYHGNKTTVGGAENDKFQLLYNGNTTIGLPGFSIDPSQKPAGTTTDESLVAMGAIRNNIRYETFLADNAYFNPDAITGVDSLDTPRITSVKANTNGQASATWDAVTNASSYRYTITYYSGENGTGTVLDTAQNTIYNTTVSFSIMPINGTNVGSVKVVVIAIADTLDADGNPTTIESAESEAYTANINKVLPTPEYHLEAVRDGSTIKYRAYLDNKQEYIDFLEAQGVTGSDQKKALEAMNVHLGIGTSSDIYVFKVANGNSGSSYYTGYNNNSNIYGYVSESTGTYISSQRNVRETMCPPSSTYTSASNIVTVTMVPDKSNQIGFKGITADTLQYQLKMRCNELTFFMRSDFMAVDTSTDGLGIPVAVSNAQLRISDTTSGAQSTLLDKLPANILDTDAYDELMVRSYPLVMSNNVVYDGHIVDISDVKADSDANSVGVSKETLEKLYVTADNQVTKEVTATPLISGTGTNRKLASGFVVELAEDGSYTLYYNALLEYNEYINYPYSKSTNMQQKTQVFYYWLSTDGLEKQPQPVLHVNDTQRTGTDGDVNADTMEFTWDLQNDNYKNEDGQSNYKVGAIYDYTIVGKTADGASVQIDTGTYTTESGKENILTYDTTQWNYTEITMSIARRGIEDNRGMTTTFPNGLVKSYTLKQRLPQVTRPTVALHKENGVVQKNTMVYDVSWSNTVTEAEEKEALQAYEITVETKKGSEHSTVDYDNESDYQTALNNLKSLYETKSGKPGIEDAARGTITYTWEESISGTSDKVEKTVVLTSTKDDEKKLWTIETIMRAMWTIEATDSDKSKETVVKSVDLNDFGRGEQVEVSVRNIANPDNADYRSSMEGVVADVQLPSRLDVPEVKDLSGDPAYADNLSITIKELGDEIVKLVYTPQNVDDKVGVRYQVAVAIYDDKQEDDVSKMASGDAPSNDTEGYWNSDALATLYSKAITSTTDAELEQNGDSLELSLENLSTDYAGKWLKVAMRSNSDSAVSSEWSDEDAMEDNTINYCWIQLPRVQEDTPDLEKDVKVLYYTDNPDADPSDTEPTVASEGKEQKRLNFNETNLADYYQIQIIRNGYSRADLQGTDEYSIQYVDWLYLEKVADKQYDVYYATSDTEHTPTSIDPDKISKVDEMAVYIGTIGNNGTRIWLPFKGAEFNETLHLATRSYIEGNIADNSLQVQLVLPNLEDGTSAALDATQVSVQARIAEDRIERYEHSQIANWYDGAEIMNLKDYADAPESLTLGLADQGKTGVAYEITAEAQNWLVYKVKLYDANGVVAYQGYVSAYGRDVPSAVSTIALLLDSYWGVVENGRAEVWAAAIIPPQNIASTDPRGGLSKWTEVIEFSNLSPTISNASLMSIANDTYDVTTNTSDEETEEEADEEVVEDSSLDSSSLSLDSSDSNTTDVTSKTDTNESTEATDTSKEKDTSKETDTLEGDAANETKDMEE